VRHLVFVNRRAPIPGTGWGCIACGLPNDGAVAVLCDMCFKFERIGPRLRFVVKGYVSERKRALLADCIIPFEHNIYFHPELTWKD
jgi:hypothetical protein